MPVCAHPPPRASTDPLIRTTGVRLIMCAASYIRVVIVWTGDGFWFHPNASGADGSSRTPDAANFACYLEPKQTVAWKLSSLPIHPARCIHLSHHFLGTMGLFWVDERGGQRCGGSSRPIHRCRQTGPGGALKALGGKIRGVLKQLKCPPRTSGPAP